MPLNPRIADWTGRTVWLIGASTGIGRATAERLHARGARVIVSARSAAPLQAFVDAHPGSEALALDATDRDALHAATQGIVARHGRIDLAVYCAGTYAPMRATEFSLEVALQHQQVNYVGALYLLDALLPQLLAQARTHIARPSRRGDAARLGAGRVRDPLSQALHPRAQDLGPAARRPVLRRRAPRHRALITPPPH